LIFREVEAEARSFRKVVDEGLTCEAVDEVYRFFHQTLRTSDFF
jgi:hypothetical protein